LMAARHESVEASPEKKLDAVPEPKQTAVADSAASELMKGSRLTPHPDPESVLQNHPIGVTPRTACQLLGIRLRQLQQLTHEGKLKPVGIGSSRRITSDSIRQRLASPKK
jgi:excisionase family DNA binding protein